MSGWGNPLKGKEMPLWPVCLAIGYLVLVPLIILVWSSLRTVPQGETGVLTLANYVRAYRDTDTREIFLNTILFAGGSSLFAVTCGFILAWLVERTDLPFKNLFYSLAIVPTAIPSMIFAISWIFILAPRIGYVNVILRKLLLFAGITLTEGPLNVYSMGGMILVEGLRLTATSFLLLAALLRNMDPSYEEAASTAGAANLSIVKYITMPLLFPGILTTAIYVLITSISIFGVPGILGMPAKIYVFSTQIYLATHPMQGGTPNYGMASTYGIMLMSLSALLLYTYYKTTAESEKYVTVSGKGYRPKVIELGKIKYPLLALVIIYFLLTIGMPIFSLVWSSLQPFYAVPSLTSLARVSLRGFQRTFHYPSFTLAVTIAFVTKDIAYGTRTTNTAILQIGKELEEAAAVAGAKRQTIMMKVTIPLLVPALINGALHMAARSFSDISIPLMLYTSGSILLSTLVWSMWEGGKLTEASVVGLLMFFAMVLLSLTSRFITARR